jgi:hypothetical protein
MQYIARTVGCGAPQALKDPYVPGQCIILGDLLFGPKDFVNPVVKHDSERGSGVGVTLTSRALAVFQHEIETLAPNAPPAPGTRLTFVFNRRPLRWTLLPGPDANLFVVTPNDRLAQRIVASLQSH